jgi:SAM-dependent methyltransferase
MKIDSPRDGRDLVALRRHYEIERELADRLRAAPAAERPSLYTAVYTELFRRVPDHPQHSRKDDPACQEARTLEQLGMLAPYLTPDAHFLEFGAGDCHLAMRIARRTLRAYGLDVSEVIPGGGEHPPNFSLLLADATSVPLPDGSISVAYSNMLVEHLHPEDVTAHLREVVRLLAPEGVYVCRTPHRYAGPQDISQYFDEVATGFHLKEYTYREMRSLFLQAGFASTAARPRFKGWALPIPQWSLLALERGLGVLPQRFRQRLCRASPLRALFNSVTFVGRKGN